MVKLVYRIIEQIPCHIHWQCSLNWTHWRPKLHTVHFQCVFMTSKILSFWFNFIQVRPKNPIDSLLPLVHIMVSRRTTSFTWTNVAQNLRRHTHDVIRAHQYQQLRYHKLECLLPHKLPLWWYQTLSLITFWWLLWHDICDMTTKLANYAIRWLHAWWDINLVHILHLNLPFNSLIGPGVIWMRL